MALTPPFSPKGPADCGGALRAVPRLYRRARRALRDAVLVESTIADCARDSRGGGAHVEQANLTLRGSRIERCRAFYGGGVQAYKHCHVDVLEGSVLSECHASLAGILRARLVAHVERALCPRTRGRGHAS